MILRSHYGFRPKLNIRVSLSNFYYLCQFILSLAQSFFTIGDILMGPQCSFFLTV